MLYEDASNKSSENNLKLGLKNIKNDFFNSKNKKKHLKNTKSQKQFKSSKETSNENSSENKQVRNEKYYYICLIITVKLFVLILYLRVDYMTYGEEFINRY